MVEAQLGEFPNVRLACLPTPLILAHQLCRDAKSNTKLFFKRDDMTGVGFGGNKVRKLEYLLAAAQKEGADTIITGGGVQSNHCQLTATAAATLGFDVHLVQTRNVPNRSDTYFSSGNVLYNQLSGAKVHLFPAGIDRNAKMNQLAESLRIGGRTPYVIPIGGSSALGCLGYVQCAQEIAEQAAQEGVLEDLRTMICATSSYGTLAGLTVGFVLLPQTSAVSVIGVEVDGDEAGVVEKRVRILIDSVFDLLRTPTEKRRYPFRIIDGYGFPGYGVTNPSALAATRLVARTEGIFLDPVYSSKAMAATLDLLSSLSHTTIFLHTGGMGSLSAYPELFSKM